MHELILQTDEQQAVPRRMRLICNAGGRLLPSQVSKSSNLLVNYWYCLLYYWGPGGLLPSLAVALQKRFCVVVLPSYGMTECMY